MNLPITQLLDFYLGRMNTPESIFSEANCIFDEDGRVGSLQTSLEKDEILNLTPENKKDIQLVVSQTDFSYLNCFRALKTNGWDVVNAILELTMP